VVLFVFIAAFLLPGLFGHDPWKTEDAVGFGVVYDLLAGGSWLAPQLAGEPYLHAGPLYFWVSAVAAKLASFVLPLHDGARIASLLGGALALYFTRLAARELYGREQGDLSTLALMGCLGFLIHVRAVMPECAVLAAVAAGYYGLAIAWKKPGKAGVLFGLGAAAAFLSGGIAAVLPLVVGALALVPLAISQVARSFVRAVGIGLAIAVVLGGAWLLAVRAAQPDYATAWVAEQWGSLSRPGIAVSTDYLKTLAWLAWPSWPLALWAAWAFRRNLRNPGFALPFAGSVVTLAVLFSSAASRETDALALLVPLSIPAGAVALFLRRGAANALSWFSLMTGGLLAIALWVMWFAMQTGFPAQLASNVAKLEPGYVPAFAIGPFVVAVIYSAGWTWFVRRAELTTLRSLPFWSAGLVLVWALAMSLWLDWIDYGKSYRTVAQGLRAAIPASADCVASRDLGEVQRAVFHYHGGLVTQRLETGRGVECRFLLVQASTRVPETLPGPQWDKLWEGGRPRDRERYRLYSRAAN
jgi:4-amino-4-deoxy-L-arabinose transferase-like glycosyltransferase